MQLFRERYLVLVFFSSLIVFSGCKKKELSYTISGSVRDITFDNALNGAEVKIYSSGAANDNFSSTVTSSSNGSYSFSFPRKNYTDITIEVSKDGYFPKKQTLIIDDLEINSENTFNYELEAMAWVKVHFIGDGVKDIKFARMEGYSGCDECCDGAEQTLMNVVDQEFLCLNKGNMNYKIYYQIIGSPTIYFAEVVTVPFEYTELLVNVQ